MITFNRTYRSPKFFLCAHHATVDYIGFEPAHERFSQFTFLSYGEGKFYAFDGKGVEEFDSNSPKTLFDVRKHLNYDVVAQSKANTKVISFNPWRKEEEWSGRLITENMVKSEYDYSCVYYMKMFPFFSNGTLFKDYGLVKAKENSLLCFPSHLDHSTPSSPLRFKRYSWAMDLNIKKDLVDGSL